MVWSKTQQSAIIVDFSAADWAASNLGTAMNEILGWIEDRGGWDITVNTAETTASVFYATKTVTSITGQQFVDKRLQRITYDATTGRMVCTFYNPAAAGSNDYSDVSTVWTLPNAMTSGAQSIYQLSGTFEFWASDQDTTSYMLVFRSNNTGYLMGMDLPQSSQWPTSTTTSYQNLNRKHGLNPIFPDRTYQGFFNTEPTHLSAIADDFTPNVDGTAFPTIIMGSNSFYLAEYLIGVNTTNSDIGAHYHFGHSSSLDSDVLKTGFINNEYYIEQYNGTHSMVFHTGSVNPNFA